MMGELSVFIEGFLVIPILRWKLNLVKTQIPQPSWRVIPISLFLFGNNRNLRFSVRTISVVRTFLFLPKNFIFREKEK